ncbi:matrix-remodeling-associated protein 7 isoform X3 [Pipistrellus kuhlii]|uniref:matrix-remodeling-associated protein 7 isoform X3 n=1 Tax=Pipistrellus kuhlii TaxID=59472 RepID=UPI001E270EE7|nr:matrix-remodeling-associated protein 7 isoform X3 [Pipistrellus kuhlii]XP_045428122.1 matrix-remodeling-associated protein 7 isoform X3 [Pipistrellus kuhlii]
MCVHPFRFGRERTREDPSAEPRLPSAHVRRRGRSGRPQGVEVLRSPALGGENGEEYGVGVGGVCWPFRTQVCTPSRESVRPAQSHPAQACSPAGLPPPGRLVLSKAAVAPLDAGTDPGEAFFQYSPGKLRGSQYKRMMTKEELEEEQRIELTSDLTSL